MRKYVYLSLATLLTSFGCQKQENLVASPTVDFTYAGTLQNFTPIQFTNSSTGAQTYLWDFGDGTLPSTEQSPVHTFKRAGSYKIMLTAAGPGGMVNKSLLFNILQADTSAIISQMVAGKYRFTKVKYSCYGAGCGGVAPNTRDTVMTISKVGNDIQVNNLVPVIPISSSSKKYYRFLVLKAVSAAGRYEANFKIGTDSLEFTNGEGGYGGGRAITYYGKKL